MLAGCGGGFEWSTVPALVPDVDPQSPDFGTVLATGFHARELQDAKRLRHEDWRERFALFTAAAAVVDDLPQVAGECFIENDAVRFVPDYPLLADVEYVARWMERDGTVAVERRFVVPRAASNRTTKVKAVFPTTDVVPSNLLKLYVEFSAPMSRGVAARYVKLLDAAGSALPLPWVAPEHELWNAAHDRLTLFFDPGRIKQGVGPNLTQGPPLLAGQDYRVVIDAAWPDATGQGLTTAFEKRFRVTAADRTAPDPSLWRLDPPSGAHAEVVVGFGEPLDRALAERMLRVVDSRGAAIAGRVRVERGETAWHFVPDGAWLPGAYAVLVDPAVEDLAGNSPRRLFDAPPDRSRETRGAVRLPFTVR